MFIKSVKQKLYVNIFLLIAVPNSNHKKRFKSKIHTFTIINTFILISQCFKNEYFISILFRQINDKPKLYLQLFRLFL